MFLVLEFEDKAGKTIGIVPDTWLDEESGKYWWPPVKNPTTFVKSKKVPQQNWSKCVGRIIKKYGMSTYLYLTPIKRFYHTS